MVEVAASAFSATASYCPTCRALYRTAFTRCPLDGAELYRSDVDPLLGAEISHYVLESCIGEGGMGRVYRARHNRLAHRLFAVKVLLGDLAATVEMRMRFAHEADAASRLSHPNVVGVVDFGKTPEGVMFLAMELVEGRSLAQLIAAEGPLSPTRATELGTQILRGLEHAHESGLVHRDLKPDNVLVARDGDHEIARIVDFGLAIEADEASASARLTRVGLALGTPMYAAPEQTHSEAVDSRADLFAFGVTLYEMLAGVVPFTGAVPQLVYLNTTGDPPRILDRAGVKVPVALEAIARRLMARDPDARYPTAAAVIEALEHASDQTAATQEMSVVTPGATTMLPVRTRSRRGGVAAVVGIGALALAAVGVFVATREPHRASTSTVAMQTVAPPPATPPSPRPIAPPPEVAVVAATAPVTAPAPPMATPIDLSPSNPVTIPSVPQPARRPAPPTRSHPRTDPEPAPEPVPEPAVVAVPVGPSVVIPDAPVTPAPVAATPVTAPVLPAPPVKLPPPPPLLTTASVDLSGLQVRGSLAAADVSGGLDRVRAALRDCYAQTARSAKKSPATTLKATFTIDASRRAADVRVTGPWPALATCATSALSGVRTRATPDVGDATVTVSLRFTPESP